MTPALRTPHRTVLLAALLAAALVGGAVEVHAQGLQAVFSRDGTDVWAVGDGGAIFRSVNAGASWSNQTLGSFDLHGVAANGYTVILVADSGRVWRSTDSGGSWAQVKIVDSPALYGVELPTASDGWIVGEGGRILHSTDSGANWTAQSSPTGQTLRAVRFRNALDGWAVGDGGTVLRTVDGGAVWTPLSSGTTNRLLAVDASGDTAWAVGEGGCALRTTDGGATWVQVPLRLDSRSDVRGVRLRGPDDVTLTGGGGFVRRSIDGGASWTFGVSPLLARTSALTFGPGGSAGWVCDLDNPVVVRTTDGGATWSLPSGAVENHQWLQRLPVSLTTVRGSTIWPGGADPRTLYGVLGNVVYRTRDAGDTWSAIATIPGATTTKTNSFYVSPRDTNLMVAAVGTPDRIVRSTDGGATWADRLAVDFSEEGRVLEMDPDRPDTLLFAPEDGQLWRSTDFGDTWSVLSVPGFRSPNDVVVVPDSDQVVYVGDGVANVGQGEIWRSLDGGLTFAKRWPAPSDTGSLGSEVPMIGVPRLENDVAAATHWSDGGVTVSTDFGGTWPSIAPTAATWGVDFARDDPNVLMYAGRSDNQTYLSLDQGQTFTVYPIAGTNSSVFGLDRSTWIAEQSNGFYKFEPDYFLVPNNSQTLGVTSPNGGESWAAGTVHAIAWNASNVPLARIEYRSAPSAPWQTVADVPGYDLTYDWTVPDDPTTTAKVRVKDAWDGFPSDTSNAGFTIAAPRLAAEPAGGLDFGTRPKGSATTLVVTLSNAGTAPTAVSSIATSSGAFTPGRSSLAVAAGAQDTVGVTFRPTAAATYVDTLVIASDAPGSPLRLPLAGEGVETPSLAVLSPTGGETWLAGAVYDIQWQSTLVSQVSLAYRTSDAAPWTPIADSLTASTGSYAWLVPYDPTSDARVRVRDVAATASDSSASPFSIIQADFVATPDPLDLGWVAPGSSVSDTLHLENPGTATLTVSNVVSSNPLFTPGRTFLLIPAGLSNSLSVTYSPLVAGEDTTVLTITTNDPASPHAVTVTGRAMVGVGVGPEGPLVFALEPGFPNPFADRTLIRYSVPVRTDVSLEVFDLQGHRVAVLARGEEEPGRYQVSFGPEAIGAASAPERHLAAGVYFCRLRTGGGFVATRKLLLLR